MKPASLSDWAAAAALLSDGIAEKEGKQSLVAIKDSVSGIRRTTDAELSENDDSFCDRVETPGGRKNSRLHCGRRQNYSHYTEHEFQVDRRHSPVPRSAKRFSQSVTRSGGSSGKGKSLAEQEDNRPPEFSSNHPAG